MADAPIDEKPIPGLTLDTKLEQKLAGLDDHLEPLKKEEKDGSTADDSKADTGEVSDEGDAEPDAGGDDPGDSGSSEDKGAEGANTDDDVGYTIDEGEEDEVDEVPKDVKVEQDVYANLSPEQKYIVENLKPITVHGTVGDDKVQAFQVYDPSQLPQGFKFSDDREMAAAGKAFSLLENRAEKLQNDYRNQESTKAINDFKKREDRADQQDIGELQRSGDIPKFKVEPNSADFDSDPAAVLIQEVLDFKDARNKKYTEEYEAGRPYKHIGFVEAFQMFKRNNPTKANVAQKDEDAARLSLAKRTSKTKGSSDKIEKRRPLARSSRDLDTLIESVTEGW